jgi:hypothetical protein
MQVDLWNWKREYLLVISDQKRVDTLEKILPFARMFHLYHCDIIGLHPARDHWPSRPAAAKRVPDFRPAHFGH